MKRIAILFIGSIVLFTSCKKKTDNPTPVATVTDSMVIHDFVAKTALPMYQALQDKATTLNIAINTLNTAPTAANLDAARTAWRDARKTWEQCEGFLIGPVEDDNYDPNMDTWPVDYNQLDSFINNSTSFTPATIAALNQSLRGFHPLEYILWGNGGAATVDSISAKEKQYMTGLSQDILDNVTQLNTSWAATGGNYQDKVLTAGAGSTKYPKRVDAMLAIAAGMAAICEEVGTGKIKEPFDAKDSTKTESPFSHNSMVDFTNNITGAQTVYLCNYSGQQGSSMSAFVSAKNIQLDNKIKDQFNTALNALANVNVSLELGVYTQRTQLQAAMDAITTLQGTLEDDLQTFIQTYVKD